MHHSRFTNRAVIIGAKNRTSVHFRHGRSKRLRRQILWDLSHIARLHTVSFGFVIGLMAIGMTTGYVIFNKLASNQVPSESISITTLTSSTSKSVSGSKNDGKQQTGIPTSTAPTNPTTSPAAAASSSPKSLVASSAQNTVTPPPASLPGRIDPVCTSSHIDRLSASDVDHQTSLMQQAGIDWVRFDVTWAAIEQTKGSYNWSSYDYDVNAVISKGMHPLAILTQYGIPSWERLDASNWMSTPNNMQDFQNFAFAFAQHYKGKISLYEIGNEPNMSMFWPSGPDPAAYTQYLIAGYKGVKAADSGNKVISAGLANISAVNYLQQMYTDGAKGYFDYVGFHPYSYPQGPDATQGTVFSTTAAIKQVMANYGQGNMQIMATELGWPSSTASTGGVDEATQAAYISRVFQKIEFEGYQYVPIACIYDFINDGTDLTNNEDNFGIVRADYSQKPSFASMQQVRQQYNKSFTPINP